MSGRMLVLLSGGIDSTVALAEAVREGYSAIPLNIEYGQRNQKEIEAAHAVADFYSLDLLTVHLGLSGLDSALTNADIPLEKGRTEKEIETTTVSSYVPCRNSILLSIAAAFAESHQCEGVYIGLNAADAAGRPSPDGRYEFLKAMELALILGSKRGMEGRPIGIWAPFSGKSKTEVIRIGTKIGAPLELTWSCFEAGERPCRECDACRSRSLSFAKACILDRALFAD